MNDKQREAPRLQADLTQLRAALRGVQAPPVDEAALRERFREAVRLRAQTAAAAAKSAGSWRMHLAAAAVVVLAIGAAFVTALKRVERPVQPVAAEVPQRPAAPLAAAAFQPLSNAPAWSPALSYSVVRVRIPVSAFAVIPGTQQDGTVEAELLVGEDGLARGIRFAGTDTVLVSVAGQ